MNGYLFGIWMILLAFAFINGAVREALFMPRMSESAAHAVSSVLLSIVVLVLVYQTIGWLDLNNDRDRILVGGVWLGLTVAFEFLAGHYLFGNSWHKILADYNILEGRLWPLVLFTIFLSPIIATRLRGLT